MLQQGRQVLQDRQEILREKVLREGLYQEVLQESLGVGLLL
jgi:hypothetical protein